MLNADRVHICPFDLFFAKTHIYQEKRHTFLGKTRRSDFPKYMPM